MNKELFKIMEDIQATHWWFRSRTVIISRILDYFLPVKKDLRIVEVGAGIGGNIDLLKRYGDLTLIEGDSYAANILKTKGNHKITKGYLPDIVDKIDAKFNLIVLIDVLEHIKNDHEALVSLKKLMNNNSLLLISVPALMFLWSYHDKEHGHVRRYNKKELQNLLIKSGYKIQFITYYNAILFPFIFFTRLLKKLLKSKTCDLKKNNSVLNYILFKIFSFEQHILFKINIPFGTSLCVIAKV